MKSTVTQPLIDGSSTSVTGYQVNPSASTASPVIWNWVPASKVLMMSPPRLPSARIRTVSSVSCTTSPSANSPVASSASVSSASGVDSAESSGSSTTIPSTNPADIHPRAPPPTFTWISYQVISSASTGPPTISTSTPVETWSTTSLVVLGSERTLTNSALIVPT